MSTYNGLDDRLRREVVERDGNRCRWCGTRAERKGVHLHHIRYRRGAVDDVAWNLISLCWECHSYVHGLSKNSPPKEVCQQILWGLVEAPGRTGAQMLRWEQRKKTDVGNHTRGRHTI